MLLLRSSPLFRPKSVVIPPVQGNILPTVALTSPTNGLTLSSGGNVSLSGTASDVDGTIAKVRFKRDGVLLRELTSAARTNYALGGIVTVSSQYSANYPSFAVNNGDRNGASWGSGGGWNSLTAPSVASPQTVTIQLASDHAPIDEINVFTLQDNNGHASPTLSTTFTQDGIVDFKLQHSADGSSWTDIISVTANNKVWYQNLPSPITDDYFRISITKAGTVHGDYARVVEFELVGDGTGTTYSMTDVNPPVGDHDYVMEAEDDDGGIAVTVSRRATVQAAPPPPPPPPPDPGPTVSSGNRVGISMAYNPGNFVDSQEFPNWFESAPRMYTNWKNPGGDHRDKNNTLNGGVYYGQITLAAGAQPFEITGLEALASRLMVDNTGIYVTASLGENVHIANGEGITGPIPKFTIVTTAGTFTPTLTHWIWFPIPTPGQGSQGQLGQNVPNYPGSGQTLLPYLKCPFILKFDMSTVSGTVLSAKLGLYNLAAGGLIICNWLDLPVIVTDPVVQLGGQVSGGLTDTYTEAQLASGASADVVFYGVQDPAVTPGQWNNYYGPQAGSGPYGRFSHESFGVWPEYGVGFQRLVSLGGGGGPNSGDFSPNPYPTVTLASWTRFIPPADEYWVRYTLKIDADVKVGLHELGIKLPGFASQGQEQNNYFDLRLEHGSQHRPNPGVYRLVTYFYTAAWLANQGLFALVEPSDTWLQEGRIYNIEQHVILNTPGSADGVVETYVDDVLVYRSTNPTINNVRGGDPNYKLDELEFHVYAGGINVYSDPNIHEDVGPVVISKSRVGRMKRIAPAWRQGATVNALTTIPNTRIQDLANTGANFNNFSGLAYDWINKELISCWNNGHGEIGSSDRFNGVQGIKLRLDNPGWIPRSAPSSDSDMLPDKLYNKDLKPAARHSYYFQNVMPSRNRVFTVGCPVAYGPGVVAGSPSGWRNVDAFDLGNNTADIRGSYDATFTNFTFNNLYPDCRKLLLEACCCSDFRNGDIYVAGLVDGNVEPGGGHCWMRLSAATLTWNDVFYTPDDLWNSCGTLIDTKRGWWVALSDGLQFSGAKVIRIIDLSLANGFGAGYRMIQITGLDAHASFGNMNQIVHDTVRDKYIVITRYGRWYEVDIPATGATTTAGRVLIGSDTMDSGANFISNRAQFDAEFDCVIYAPDARTNLQFMARS